MNSEFQIDNQKNAKKHIDISRNISKNSRLTIRGNICSTRKLSRVLHCIFTDASGLTT